MKAPHQVLNTIQILLVIYIGPGSLGFQKAASKGLHLCFPVGALAPPSVHCWALHPGQGAVSRPPGASQEHRAVSFFPYPLEASQQPREEAERYHNPTRIALEASK